jgi:hypothetical protein
MVVPTTVFALVRCLSMAFGGDDATQRPASAPPPGYVMTLERQAPAPPAPATLHTKASCDRQMNAGARTRVKMRGRAAALCHAANMTRYAAFSMPTEEPPAP